MHTCGTCSASFTYTFGAYCYIMLFSVCTWDEPPVSRVDMLPPPCHSHLQVLPYSLSYCTPPYSPSSTVSAGEEPCSAAVLPVDTAPTAGCVSQTAVKAEAPSSSEACAQQQWMSHLFMPPALTQELPLDSSQLSVVHMCISCCVLHVRTYRGRCTRSFRNGSCVYPGVG